MKLAKKKIQDPFCMDKTKLSQTKCFFPGQNFLDFLKRIYKIFRVHVNQN